ncbi:MmyB family transcriptional regulator [Microbispora bryophytorum]|uniref:MmyB family transcriptional regulator n=1 Tax=Microbispora bryophytorum TaxID=1460882 RepID=UPI0033CDFAC3
MAVRTRRVPERVPDSTRRLLRVMGTPAVVLGRHLDVLAWNTLAEALPGDPDTTAEPGTADAERLQLLASLHATRVTRKAQAERPGLFEVVRRQGLEPRTR